MKSSIHFLLVSSTLISHVSLDSTEVQETSQEQGNIVLESKDNYDGTNTTPFSQRKSSLTNGTTYTLSTDISFANVSSTQEQTSEETKNEEVSKEADEENNAEEEKTQTQNVETQANIAKTALPTTSSSLSITKSTQPESSNPSSSQGTPECSLTTTLPSTDGGNASVTTGAENSTSNSITSSSGSTNTSCFVNTDGTLSFVGNNHSLTFSNISITGKGSAINNSANSSLTFSGFSDLSFISATADISTAESAIYVGPKNTTTSESSEEKSTVSSTTPGNTSSGSNGNPSADASKVVTVSTAVMQESQAPWETSEIEGRESEKNDEEDKEQSQENSSLTFKSKKVDSFNSHLKGSTNSDVSNSSSSGSLNSVSSDSSEQPSSPSISFCNNANITLSGNNSKNYGGAIQVLGNGSITKNTGTVTLSNNMAQDQGGAIYSTGSVEITENATVIFSGNKTIQSTSSGSSEPSKSASEPAVSAAVTTEPSNQSTTVSSNTQGHGGAICCITSSALSEDTETDSPYSPSALLRRFYANIQAQLGSTYQDSTSSNLSKVTISGNASVTFSNNSAYGSGGAIYSESVFLSSGGDITFAGNTASQGGAIYITDGGTISISATNGNISFWGNTQTTAIDPSITGDTTQTDTASKTLTSLHNSLYLGKGAKILQLRAGTGHSLTFYDPIITQPIDSGSSSTPLRFNAADDQTDLSSTTTYDGRIVFSGEKLTEEEAQDSANTTSIFHCPVVLESGTMVLKNGATLCADSFIQNPGSLIIMDGGTTIRAGFVSTTEQQPSSQNESTLNNSTEQNSENTQKEATQTPPTSTEATALTKATDTPTFAGSSESQATKSSLLDERIVSKYLEEVCKIRTLLRDLPFSLPVSSTGTEATTTPSYTQQTAADGSITISNLAVNLDSLGSGQVINIIGNGNTGKVSVTGDLQFVDSSGQFYDNPLLSKNFSTDILSISAGQGQQVDTSGLNIIPQGSTTSNFGYQGQWEVIQVKDPTSGQISFELKWESQGYNPSPARRATLVPNSLWCSAIDIQAIQKLVEVSTDSANAPGFWVAGISNFFHRDSTSIQQGFRHISSGYMLGTSFESIDGHLMDIAFCQLFGRDKDYNLAHTKSHIYAATIHSKQERMMHYHTFSNKRGTIISQLPDQFLVILDAHLSYSLARNAMETQHTPNPASIGKWNNHCVSATLGGTLPRRYFSPYAQLRVVFVEQQNFKERHGGDENREFQSAHLMNIATPLGLKFERNTPSNKLILSLGYSPDIYRLYPKSKVYFPSGSISWATGATNLARQALLVEGSAHHSLGNSFKIFSHAAFELRGSSRNYNADLGGKYIF
ncbi:polymorphic outer membrane protein middle domain-containing protein [Chlamydia avium]|uniref:Autotransporter beta-domain protein n=1 Tax=Chlamydia avium TaxID=1457141 RepID=A0ABP2X5T3_9CHLA|nr:polymorphic outer membrane protein middle domain-containing protein [Chlamydia avium]EPP37065.1 autotransporter beta-domain protein [Chlamydia psittaci 10_743_SC13]EPP37997.1 autotransporter beta-domain protein [Chlamydia avium]